MKVLVMAIVVLPWLQSPSVCLAAPRGLLHCRGHSSRLVPLPQPTSWPVRRQPGDTPPGRRPASSPPVEVGGVPPRGIGLPSPAATAGARPDDVHRSRLVAATGGRPVTSGPAQLDGQSGEYALNQNGPRTGAGGTTC